MGIKFYKLNYYKPFWTIDNTTVPYDHVETIVKGIEDYLNKAQNSNVSLWTEIKENFEWVDIDTIKATGTKDTIPEYIKVDINGDIYYYYLLSLGNVVATKKGDTYYAPQYLLDKYMTVFNHKMNIMYEANPNVYQLYGFDNRWKSRTTTDENGNPTTEYVIDFILQRHLSNTVTRNNMMVRELAYYTSPATMFTLNFPSVTPPATVSFNNAITGANAITRAWTQMTTQNSRGRYEYIVAKSTALMSSNNSKLKSTHTSQKFILIPLFSGFRTQILHALNDFDITGAHDQILDPWGDNQIGLFECDIPFSIFYGYKNASQYGVEFKYVNQYISSTETIEIPYFEIDNNAPMLIKIIDYTQYGVGFYGKFKTFIDNIYIWAPESEPALWNPTYYKEVYNNGNSNLVTDASFFIWKWDGTSVLQMGVQAYLSWQDSLNIAYNYGVNTNSALATLDNTETQSANLSLSNMYFGSASANYFTTNSTTINTSMASRASEEKQAWVDAALDSAKAWNAAAPTTIIPWKAAMQAAKGFTNAALVTAKVMTDTALSQQRANNELKSSINNLTSSPASVLSNPSTKGVIPNKHGLFETYSIKLHPNDEKVIFTDYCNNGYPTNEIKPFQQVFNRQIMNIMQLDTTYFSEYLKQILIYRDSSIFNTPTWNQEFLNWMNEKHKIYNTWWIVNCTNYYGENYVSNIEKELPVIPTSKTHISRYITSFRAKYAWDSILDNLRTDNSSAPAGIWSDIEITNISSTGFVIRTKPTSTLYYGTISVNAIIYDGYVQDGTTYHYFFGNVDFLCTTDSQIVMPDGHTYNKSTFNLPIIYNNAISLNKIPDNYLYNCAVYNTNISFPIDITTIGHNFLFKSQAFNSSITLPSTLKKIGDNFLATMTWDEITRPHTVDCHFNTIINLPNGLTSIGRGFLRGQVSFNQNISLPNTLTHVGRGFMNNMNLMHSTVNINSLTRDVFEADEFAPLYTRLDLHTTLSGWLLADPCVQKGIFITGTHAEDFRLKFLNIFTHSDFKRNLREYENNN